MPVPTLPYELWAMIASFMPNERLVKLYSVNQALFDLAMDEIYRNVSIYHRDDENTLRCILNME